MYEFVNYKASDYMTMNVTTVSPDATLAEAHHIFESHDFNTLPVVDGSRLVGVLTKLDLLRSFCFNPESIVPHYEEIMRTQVSAAMQDALHVVEPDTPLTRVLEKMVRTHVKSFPVVRGDHLVGMIAREDLLRVLEAAAAGSGRESERA